MSADVEAAGGAAAAPPAWERLEFAGERARLALEAWRTRALEAEAEVDRLRNELELVSAEPVSEGAGSREAIRRLRAENAALKSRLAQARRRVGTLLAWTDALEETR